MAEIIRSSVIGVKEETTEGTPVAIAAGTEFTAIREGFSVQSTMETVDSDELVDDIGASAPFTTKEAPTASIPKYIKHSGTAGQAPDYAVMIKSAMGTQTDNGTEYDTVSSSTAGTATAAAVIKVDSAEGANFAEGQALLIKDGTNGYSIRNVKSISSDDLTINYNLASAPASGVNLGKANHFSPAATGHVTYSLHHYQASSSSALHQLIAGARTVGMTLNFPVNDLATIDFDIQGMKHYQNPIVIASSNKYIDFKDLIAGSELTATLTEKTYESPKALASEVSTKMTAASTNGDTITCSFDSTTGKYTIATDGSELELLWSSGTNTANSADSTLGYTTADDTGATTYTSDNVSTYSPSYTPSLDSTDPIVVKNQELMIGPFSRYDCRPGNNVSISINTPKTDVEDFCAESGISSSVVLEREVTLSTTLIFDEHEVDEYDYMKQNTTTQIMFNCGQKDASGNWVAGKCFNFWMPNAKISSHVISESDGLMIVELEAKGFVTSGDKDCHINFI